MRPVAAYLRSLNPQLPRAVWLLQAGGLANMFGNGVVVPFLIIDLVVASVLMSMGMMMVSPALIALPFKLMLFVLVDGWNLLLGSLAQSFSP